MLVHSLPHAKEFLNISAYHVSETPQMQPWAEILQVCREFYNSILTIPARDTPIMILESVPLTYGIGLRLAVYL